MSTFHRPERTHTRNPTSSQPATMADTESKQSTVAAAAETTKEVAASAVEDTKEAASAAGDKVAVATGVKEPESPTLLGQTISTALDAVDKVVTTVKDFDEKYAAGKARLWVEGAISVVSGAAKNVRASLGLLVSWVSPYADVYTFCGRVRMCS